MLDGVSLDQLRTFIAAVDEGSFSAAGRRLGRAQSVVSQTMANLESQLGVRLFERGGRLPVLTAAGKALLTDARTVAHSMDLFKARARGLAGGLEPEVSIVVDVMFPTEVLTSAVAAFHAEFPNTPLRISVDGLGAVIEPVLDGRCAFGIRGTLPISPPELRTRAPARHRLSMGRVPEPSPRGQARADSGAKSSPATSSWCSATARTCPKAGTWACSRHGRGGCPTSAPSTPSFGRASAGAACRSTSSRRIWQPGRSSP